MPQHHSTECDELCAELLYFFVCHKTVQTSKPSPGSTQELDQTMCSWSENYFPAGALRRSSSNQLTMMCSSAGPVCCGLFAGLIARNRLPSSATSYAR